MFRVYCGLFMLLNFNPILPCMQSSVDWVMLDVWCAAQSVATVSWTPSGRGHQPMASAGVTLQWPTGECTGTEGGEHALQLHAGAHHHGYGPHPTTPAPLLVTPCGSHAPWPSLSPAAGLHADCDAGSQDLHLRGLAAGSPEGLRYPLQA